MNLISPDILAIITIYQEAAGEPFAGKVAVGEVIRNRMARKYASDGSVAGTIARRFQFSAWNDDAQDNALLIRSLKLDDADPIVVQCRQAWYTSAHTQSVNGAVLYCNLAVIDRPAWAKDEKQAAVIGRHTFYRDP